MKYGELTLGQVEALVNKLGGMEGVQRFLSGELIVSLPTKVWKTWNRINLGTGLKSSDFQKAIKSARMIVSDRANDILSKPNFQVAQSETEVELVVTSVSELGFKDDARMKDIYNRAQELGLHLCPSEVGPQLRLKYGDQPKGEWFVIAMKPIADSNGGLCLFDIGSDGGERSLNAVDGNPDSIWYGHNRFVFLRHK